MSLPDKNFLDSISLPIPQLKRDKLANLEKMVELMNTTAIHIPKMMGIEAVKIAETDTYTTLVRTAKVSDILSQRLIGDLHLGHAHGRHQAMAEASKQAAMTTSDHAADAWANGAGWTPDKVNVNLGPVHLELNEDVVCEKHGERVGLNITMDANDQTPKMKLQACRFCLLESFAKNLGVM